MRAIIYARYSTDKQSESSIDDQVRLCRRRAQDEGWEIVATYGDSAVSGSVAVGSRSGGKAMLADALAARFEVLLVEGLDRLSRDQVEQERIVRRLEHRGIRLVGVCDGYDSAHGARKIMRGVRGLINELYLDDLRLKTHRGQVGQVGRGFVVSGPCYGYRLVKTEQGTRYEVNEDQARWVREIFAQYAAGEGVHRIVYGLNRLAVPSPRGGTWAVSAVYGSPVKGSGILNNPLYVGRYVWNRSQWVKDPDTGQRKRMDRPQSEWLQAELPELRIVDQDTWNRVRQRMDAGRDEFGRKRMQRPASSLFGGLLHCPHCKAPMIAINDRRYGCVQRKDRGPSVCRGYLVSRELVDRRLVAFIREDLLAPEAASEFERAFMEILAQESGSDEARARMAARLVALKAEITRLVDGIATVGVSASLAARLTTAEAEKLAIEQSLRATREAPALPDIREMFRRQLMNLGAALKESPQKARAAVAEIIGHVQLELCGEDGKEVWAQMQTDRLAEMATGRSLSVL
jgi:site-specific DNA recombinase